VTGTEWRTPWDWPAQRRVSWKRSDKNSTTRL